MIGIIGCGNMASAIVKGVHQADPKQKFVMFDPDMEKSKALAGAVNGKSAENHAGLSEADSILIGCKPQQFAGLVSDLEAAGFDLGAKHWISIMAAMPIKTIQNKLGAKKVTRVMPNTPMMYNEGVSLLLHSDEVSSQEKALVEKSFGSVGTSHPLADEESFDQVTTVSGSGPAYVFYFAKTMADKLAKWGVDDKEARDIVVQLFKGSTKLMEKNSDTSLDDLIAQVTSKGGVTIEAVKVYQERQLDQITEEALEAAFKRSVEMTNELGS
ncbi:MAG: pyrroline-5-carboxylate reductase [Bacteriovoracaceae bacterium]